MGEPISEMSALEQARRRAVLPQEHTIGFTFTLRRSGADGPPRLGPHRSAPRRRCRRGRGDDRLRCDGFARRSSSLSGGERGRVALARVWRRGRRSLVLDEPTAAMDPHYQGAGHVRRAAGGRRGAAALVVVHDLNLAAAYSDRVAVLAPDEDGVVGWSQSEHRGRH